METKIRTEEKWRKKREKRSRKEKRKTNKTQRKKKKTEIGKKVKVKKKKTSTEGKIDAFLGRTQFAYCRRRFLIFSGITRSPFVKCSSNTIIVNDNWMKK